MDVLTDIIQLLRPRTVLLGAMAASGRWGVRVPPQPGPTFYFVTQGRCWFGADGAEPVELVPGDYLLSARPLTDTFVSQPGAGTGLSDEAFKARHTVDGEIRLGNLEDGETTRILGGLIVCDPANAELLVGLLPPVMHVRAEEAAGARLGNLIAMVRDEAGEMRPGRDTVLSRLIEVMLVETLRREAALVPHAGVLGGLADPQLAKALANIHADVGRGWTVEELARDAGMSRAVFARKFSQAIGAAPVEYLLSWRMALAKEALLHGRGSLEEIALKIGYRSASAFSTAFSRMIGCPPSEYTSKAVVEAA
ncbi:AraC family transcriptional regulator [Rhizobium sp. XQZ8]|uniref:AraC family transcriptional regulator n=1 Tax=Rhizobium populisoli TaxID=2859785 RepID=UPI001C673E7F|nr:AraC family transcriptional regulator [Rhizobium populisoli]MBW6420589.1 AraC family transcriptional regulator [Rhizobium populisoli]